MDTLTEEQKKRNHIKSETRRRDNIRAKFDELVDLVPDLTASESRSEQIVLTKTANYIEQLRKRRQELEEKLNVQ